MSELGGKEKSEGEAHESRIEPLHESPDGLGQLLGEISLVTLGSGGGGVGIGLEGIRGEQHAESGSVLTVVQIRWSHFQETRLGDKASRVPTDSLGYCLWRGDEGMPVDKEREEEERFLWTKRLA